MKLKIEIFDFEQDIFPFPDGERRRVVEEKLLREGFVEIATPQTTMNTLVVTPPENDEQRTQMRIFQMVTERNRLNRKISKFKKANLNSAKTQLIERRKS